MFFLTNVCELYINMICSFDLGIKLLFPAKAVDVTMWIYAEVTGKELALNLQFSFKTLRF